MPVWSLPRNSLFPRESYFTPRDFIVHILLYKLRVHCNRHQHHLAYKFSEGALKEYSPFPNRYMYTLYRRRRSEVWKPAYQGLDNCCLTGSDVVWRYIQSPMIDYPWLPTHNTHSNRPGLGLISADILPLSGQHPFLHQTSTLSLLMQTSSSFSKILDKT